jgi:hypothetical protein
MLLQNKKLNKWFGNIFIVMLFSFILWNPGKVKADGEVEISGAIEAKTGSSITVNTIQIIVNSSTVITSNMMHTTILFDSLKIGSLVNVEAVSQSSGLLTASKIERLETQAAIQMEGSITAVTAGSFILNGINVLTNSSTAVYSQFHASLKFSDLKAGDRVSVHASRDTSGTYVAISIMVFTKDSNREVEADGRVQALTSNSIKVMDKIFIVDSTTVILKEESEIIKLNQIATGDKVEIRGLVKTDSTYLALVIKVENASSMQKVLELEGAITTINTNTFVVSGITCTVDSSTVISAENGNMLNFSDLKVGDRVHVTAVLQSGNIYLASKIKLDVDEAEKEFEVEGLIQSVSSDNFTVGGYTIYVNSQTKIYNQLKQNISFSTLTEGTFVHVRAFFQNNNYYADFIKVGTNNTVSNYSGAIESINGSTLQVKGLFFLTDQNTEFLDDDRNTITINDLKVGQFVNIMAANQGSNQYLALRVVARDFWRPTISVEGAIENLTLTSITVMGKTFTVDSSTLVVGTGTGVILFSNLSLGMNVEIKGALNTGGVLTAKLIKIHPNQEFKLYGEISSISGTQLIVAGLTIKTDQNTVYFDEFDKSITFDSLKLNQQVEVRYVKASFHDNLAVKIEVEKEPNSVVISDVVTSSASGSLQLSSANVAINNNTLLLSSSYSIIQSSSISAGQTITVWANQNSDGTLSAVQVQQMSGSVTAIADGNKNDLPTAYELKQNYPNPFNPSTNIVFTLAKQEEVKLEVYNVIGQRVAILTNGTMSAGSHAVEFNAVNLTSGIYFYKIKAGDFISVKKMILLK